MRVVQNIFIECEKIFRSSITHFEIVINLPQLVQKLHGNPCVISVFDALGYSIEPKFNSEISLNLLKNMLLLFGKARPFSFARDVKERLKARIKKVEKGLL